MTNMAAKKKILDELYIDRELSLPALMEKKSREFFDRLWNGAYS